MPDPPSMLERAQARLTAAGIPPDLIKVTGVERDADGVKTLKVSVTAETLEEMIKQFGIRLHTGTERDEQLPRIVGIGREGEPPKSLESWTATERQKRAKPKKGPHPDHS